MEPPIPEEHPLDRERRERREKFLQECVEKALRNAPPETSEEHPLDREHRPSKAHKSLLFFKDAINWLFLLGLCLVALYWLIRFVKWAWMNN